MVLVGVVNFGGQYNHLIYRRLTELGANAVLFNPLTPVDDVIKSFDGIVVSGGPQNIPEDLPKLGYVVDYVTKYPGPLLGICLGHHIISYIYGGELGDGREFGVTTIYVDDEDEILRGLGPKANVWESHNRAVIKEPKGFKVLAHSDKVRVQALASLSKPIYSVQFHPEVTHTERGEVVFVNFIRLCRW